AARNVDRPLAAIFGRDRYGFPAALAVQAARRWQIRIEPFGWVADNRHVRRRDVIRRISHIEATEPGTPEAAVINMRLLQWHRLGFEKPRRAPHSDGFGGGLVWHQQDSNNTQCGKAWNAHLHAHINAHHANSLSIRFARTTAALA